MREIKFRAWDIKAKKMGVVINLKTEALDVGGALGIGADFVYNEDLDKHADIEPLAVFRRHETLDPECYLMQYTGFKDKNGKEIYEGDIFKITQKPEEINSVTFYFGSWHLEEHGLHLEDWYDKGEAIGNIYENKELLD